MSTSTLFSGGADGADAVWVRAASSHNVRCVIYTFQGHSVRLPTRRASVTVLTEDQLVSQDVRTWLRQAAINLNKRPPADGYVHRLLARSVFVAKSADALYAVGKRRAARGRGTGVEGGTGWTCEMFALMAAAKDGAERRMFMFDTDADAWLEWDTPNAAWVALKEGPPCPTTFRCWAGIGSRDIGAKDAAAIEAVFKS